MDRNLSQNNLKNNRDKNISAEMDSKTNIRTDLDNITLSDSGNCHKRSCETKEKIHDKKKTISLKKGKQIHECNLKRFSVSQNQICVYNKLMSFGRSQMTIFQILIIILGKQYCLMYFDFSPKTFSSKEKERTGHERRYSIVSLDNDYGRYFFTFLIFLCYWIGLNTVLSRIAFTYNLFGIYGTTLAVQKFVLFHI